MTKRAVICALALIAGCADKSSGRDSAAMTTRQASALSASVGPDSARAFAQRFYDWYLATEARHGDPYDSLLTSRRAWLADTLARALQADIAMQRADTVAEIASLSADGDIFLNSQDACSRYTARTPHSLGTDGFAIPIAGNCSGLDAKPNIELHVRPRAASWVIVNVKDPTEPKYDLLAAFTHYRAEMLAPHDSAGPDTSPSGGASARAR